MKKIGVIIAVSIIIVLVFGIFAVSSQINESLNSSNNLDKVQTEIEQKKEKIEIVEKPEKKQNRKEIEKGVSERLKKVSDSDELSETVKGFVTDFVEKKGITPDEVNKVSKIDFNNLSKDLDIKNVKDNNLAIYKVEYNDSKIKSNESQKVFVITYSTGNVVSQGDIIVNKENREILNFGLSDETNESRFLKTATGVVGSLETGYVMLRAGSITGISTSLNAEGIGEIEIIIYKNGKQIQFGNSIDVSLGIKKDYDLQSKGTVTFEPGDVISAYAKITENGKVSYKDVITIVEITTI